MEELGTAPGTGLIRWSMSSSARARRAAARAPLRAETRLGDWTVKGATVARLEERTVAVDRGLPGELVDITIDRRRRTWRGVVDTVREASPDRIAPPCPAYLLGCGGCQWQHIRYDAQIAAKRMQADREMERHAVSLRVTRVHEMEYPWRYRHTAAIALGWEAGFRPRGRRGIVEVRDCPISHPSIGALAAELNGLLAEHVIPPYHGKVWLDCTVVGTDDRPGLQVVIQGIEGLTLEAHPELPEVAAALVGCKDVVSVAFRHRSGLVHALVGELQSQITVDGQPMWLPAGAFSQANMIMLDRLIDRIRPEIEGRQPDAMADIYGGVGTFALAFAPLAHRMVLVELDASAVEAARRTASDRRLNNVTFVSQHAERALPSLGELDVVVVDPPRSGLGSTVTDALIASPVRTIVYVSCSPASLAFDLAALQAGRFAPQCLELLDFYPQTYHAECLTILDRPA